MPLSHGTASRFPASCAAGQYGSTLIKLPAPSTENDDTNPPRVAPRNLFDLAVGDDNLFHGDFMRPWRTTGHENGFQEIGSEEAGSASVLQAFVVSDCLKVGYNTL